MHVKLESKIKMNLESQPIYYNNCSRHAFKSWMMMFLLWCGCAVALPMEASAQEKETAAEEIAEDKQKTDSVKLIELTLQLEEMKLNEILLKSQLEENNQNHIADSIKKALQVQRIDSLREVTPGVPVVVEGDTLFKIYAARGGHSALDRASTASEMMTKIGHEHSLKRDSVYLLDNENYIDIMYGDKVIMSVTEQDAIWNTTTPQKLAEVYMPLIADKIRLMKAENSFWQMVKRGALFLIVVCVQCLLVKLINYLFRKLRRKIIRFKQQRMKPLELKGLE